MSTPRSLLLALFTTACLLAPAASQATTIFERFAPPLPIPVPVPVPMPMYGDVRIEQRYDDYHRPPPPRYEYRYDERRYYGHDDWHHHHHHRHDDRREPYDERHWR